MQIDIQRRFSLLTPAALLTNVRLQTGLLLWALLVFAPAAGAQATCQGGVVSVPVLSPFSVSAAVGDYTLTCGGGASISPLPTMEFLASFAVEVVNTGPPTVTDGVNNYIGVVASNQVQFSDVPFNPVAMNFEFENIFVDANELAPGSQFFESMFISGATSVLISGAVQEVAVNGSAPEPSTFPLAGIALGAVVLLARRT